MGFRRHDTSGYHPAWTATIGAMLDAIRQDLRLMVKATCDTCGGHRDVNFEKMIAARGRDYSLVNRRVLCRFQRGCTGRVRFSYSHGAMRNLWDDATAARWSEIDRARKDEGRRYIADALRNHKFEVAEKKARERH